MSSPLVFPVLTDSQYSMRPYQNQAVETAIDWLFNQHKPSGILQLCTGAGKTAIVGELFRRLYESNRISTRILFLAHRTELITQSYSCFERSGLAPGREQASHRMFGQEYDPQVVCATVQTVHARLDSIPPDTFDFVVIDECHNSASPTYRRVIEHFNRAKVLGVTATIDRADRKGLDHLTEVIYRYSLLDGIRDGYLTPIKFVRCSVGANLRNCRTIGKSGELDMVQLGELIEPHIERLANAIRQEAGHKKTLIFMPCVKSAAAMSSALIQLGVASDWVSGDRSGRAGILQSHKTNKITTLVNCQLLGEGYDDPSIECVVPRPTMSRIAYAQMVGRGCRLFPDKEFCRIIDFDHMTDKDLIGPGSLAELGSSEEAEFAKAIEDDKGIDLMEAVEQAKEKVKQNAEAVRVRVRAMELSYRRVEVTPFDAVTAFGVKPDLRNWAQYGSAYGEKATEAQSRVLEKMGVTGTDTTSKTQASRLISAAIERRNQGLCTLKQISMLIGLGVDRAKARKMSFEDASKTITERLQNA